jgi:hypothetical protein
MPPYSRPPWLLLLVDSVALAKRFIPNLHGLTTATLWRHPPHYVTMVKGHLDQSHQNQRLTRRPALIPTNVHAWLPGNEPCNTSRISLLPALSDLPTHGRNPTMVPKPNTHQCPTPLRLLMPPTANTSKKSWACSSTMPMQLTPACWLPLARPCLPASTRNQSHPDGTHLIIEFCCVQS